LEVEVEGGWQRGVGVWEAAEGRERSRGSREAGDTKQVKKKIMTLIF
jgi:hypothetical protein